MAEILGANFSASRRENFGQHVDMLPALLPPHEMKDVPLQVVRRGCAGRAEPARHSRGGAVQWHAGGLRGLEGATVGLWHENV